MNNLYRIWLALILFISGSLLALTPSHSAPLKVTLQVEQQVSCFSGSNGRVAATATGGTEHYRYAWSTGATGTATLDNLPTGIYSVTVTDTAGDTAQAAVTVTEPAGLEVRASAERYPTCYAATDGRASVAVSGGTPPYEYNWSNGATGVTADGLPGGFYEVVVIDANLCGTSSGVAVREPDSLALAFATAGDAGPGDGTATVMAAGGTEPYTYTWSTNPVRRSATIQSLPSGTYAVTVSDRNGCTVADSVSVDRLPPGARCTTALALDSLLGGAVEAPRYLTALNTGNFPGSATTEADRPDCFVGRDTLHHPVWMTFTGDGRPYRLRPVYCGPGGNPAGVRVALYAGSCGEAVVRTCSSGGTIELLTEPGQTYTLLVDDTLAAGSSRCLEVTAITTTSVHRPSSTWISLYPNPSSGYLRLDEFSAREVEVYDAAGRKVAAFSDPGTELDLSGYPAGIYHLRITDRGARTYVTRIIKQ
ncbi:T9SS type A sorting domain-containing protein [Lewinella sp. IMCC34183]|uniref:T9SS type A sorting domain-containing protein n=1 Tax=Lewinella sp. IMCC34183 TaxID=2248762 RepID=UPI000E26AE1A|nr:T9SS type A sorting domain-containing protein [Lewinella sp. IMCC34183]